VLVVAVNLLGNGTPLNINPSTGGLVDPRLPYWLEPGEALPFRDDAARFSERVRRILEDNFPNRGPVSKLMTRMRVQFLDGEGHDHFASLDKESAPQLAVWLDWISSQEVRAKGRSAE
jgi:hypothetical protein